MNHISNSVAARSVHSVAARSGVANQFGGHFFPQLMMQSLKTIGGDAGHRSMHAGRLPPGQPPGAGGAGGVGGPGGAGGVGEGGAGVGGAGGSGGPEGMVVPMSPNRISEKVALCGPPVSVVDVSHGPALVKCPH